MDLKSERFQCNSCGARYNDRSPDGGPYFHACALLQTDDNGLVARKNARDENLTPLRSTGLYAIKAEGDGATCLTNQKLTEPSLITALKQRQAVQEQRDNE